MNEEEECRRSGGLFVLLTAAKRIVAEGEINNDKVCVPLQEFINLSLGLAVYLDEPLSQLRQKSR